MRYSLANPCLCSLLELYPSNSLNWNLNLADIFFPLATLRGLRKPGGNDSEKGFVKSRGLLSVAMEVK